MLHVCKDEMFFSSIMLSSLHHYYSDWVLKFVKESKSTFKPKQAVF